MKKFRLAFKYLKYVLTARHSGGFGVHSPFIFSFIQYVVKETLPFYAFEKIEQKRRELQKDTRILSVKDFGTGQDGNKEVRQIAARALKNPEQAQLLFRIVNYYHCEKVCELGSSLGITTMYLAAATGSGNKCISMEGCPETAAIARENFTRTGMRNIDLNICNIDDKLEDILAQNGRQDFFFIDANHCYEALSNYFKICLNYSTNKTIIVVDDIYRSEEMEKAWEEIKNHPAVKSTIDLFYMGIVFLNPDLNKKHYKVKF